MKTKIIFLKTILTLGPGTWILELGILSAQTPGEWTWMHGESTFNSTGVFGAQGISNSTNTPPAVYEPCEWQDKNGNFWLFGGGMGFNDIYAALWQYDPDPASPTYNRWTWIKGPSAVNQNGVYGTQGVPSPANYPGSRYFGTTTWVDTSGNFWLFGGYGYGATGGLGSLNDLWKYDPNPASPTYNQWTWMKGADIIENPGSYGSQGVSDPANLPQSRSETSCSWTDYAGNLWLYGGVSPTPGGRWGDLWKYNILSNEWTWMHGVSTPNPSFVHGIQGVANPVNTPGGRWAYCSWSDLAGNFWFFAGTEMGPTNDLWKYDPNPASSIYNQWTWINGPTTYNNPGNYGARCIPTNNNMPPARTENRARVRDTCGNFWNFGGGLNTKRNDLWHYNVSTNQWTWVSGDNLTNQAAVYGAKGVSDPANKPGAKTGSVAWMDNKGYIWLFGGSGIGGYYNDLFRYVPDTACKLTAVAVAVSSNLTICSGQNATLTAAGGINYLWLPGGQTTANIVVSPSASATYTVIGRSPCSSDSSSVSVTVIPLPSVTASSDATICNGQSATLTAMGGTNYSWSPGGQSASNIVVSPTISTAYTVTDSNACGSIGSSVNITVNPSPTVTAWNDVTVTAGSSVTLNSSSPSVVTYSWSPATGLSCTTCATVTVTPFLGGGGFMYCVTVTDNNGCTDDSCVTITVEPIDCSHEELYLPNAFSPNGDGENDALQVYYGNINCLKEFQLTIYDRWGEKVFKTTDPGFQWEGKNNGITINTSVLVYYLRVTIIDEKEMIRKGNISLIR